MSLEPLFEFLAGTPTAVARSGMCALTLLLLAAAWCDWRRQRIPNALVLPGCVLAITMHALLPAGDGFVGILPGALGFGGALAGMAIGLLALMPLYLLGGMGAGDVKLLAMVGAFLGPAHFGRALLAILLAGGVLAIAIAVRRHVAGRVLNNLRQMLWNFEFSLRTGVQLPDINRATAAGLPFGVAIAAGCIAYLVYRAQFIGLI